MQQKNYLSILEFSDSGTIGTNLMGPVSTHICEVSNQLAELGHAVTVIDTKSDTERSLLSSKVRLIELDIESRKEFYQKCTGRFTKIIKPWLHEKNIVKSAMIQVIFPDFDIIHIHENILCNTVLRYCNKSTVVYTEHTAYWLSNIKKKNWKKNIIDKLFMGLKLHPLHTIKKASLVTCVGSFLNSYLPKARFEYIPNGINISNYPLVSRSDARKKLNKPTNQFIITSIGRISYWKGFDVLIEAVKILVSKNIEVSVNIIGSLSGEFGDSSKITPYANSLINSSEGLPVNFLGFIPNNTEKFVCHVASSNLVVVPSRFEAQGKVVLEAMGLSVPVLVSDVGGLPDMVTSDVGRIFKSEDPKDLADKIESLVLYPNSLVDMGRHSRDLVINKYSWTNITKQYINSFNSL